MMAGHTVRVKERIRLFTPLGIRFWDAALDVPITGGLVTHAWLRGGHHAPVRGVRGPGGVHSFHGLPGLRATEQPAADDAHPEISVAPLEYTVIVQDPGGAYLPATFSVQLPLGYRGEFLAGGTESPPAGGRAYLFSAPARTPPPGTSPVRIDLLDADTGGPAAWAAVRVEIEGSQAEGIADARGRALVPVPLPTVDRLRLGSPPGAGQGSPLTHTWPVVLSVRYEPGALRYPFAGGRGIDASWSALPSLKSILDEQSAALIVVEADDPPVNEWTQHLLYGEELRPRTVQFDGSGSSSVWIHAGAPSPP
jgi:hypothetical protein